MAKSFSSWDKPASSWGGKPQKYTDNYNIKRLISWDQLDWEQLASSCSTAITIAIEAAELERKASYKRFIDSKEKEWQANNPESGPYEGNWSDAYPYSSLDIKQSQLIKQEATAGIIDTFCEANNLKELGIQLLPLIITYLSRFKLSDTSGDDYSPVKATRSLQDNNSDGLISGKYFFKQVFSSGKGKGLYYFLMHDSRSKYLETQYKGAAKNFSALVPLVLYAFKLTQGIPYSHWNKDDIPGIVNPKLAMAMLWDESVNPKPSVEDIIKSREIGLSVKSGPKAGQTRSPVYTYKLYGTTPISHLPEDVQTMYAQIWVAHPENRSKYMVLDPSNWDTMPPALISSEALVTERDKTPIVWSSSTTTPKDWTL